MGYIRYIQFQEKYFRFGSVHYTGAVYVNGRHVGSHSGGHLPFSFNLSAVLNFSQEHIFKLMNSIVYLFSILVRVIYKNNITTFFQKN